MADYLRLSRAGPTGVDEFNCYFRRGLSLAECKDPLAAIVAAGSISNPVPADDPIVRFLNEILDRFSHFHSAAARPAASAEQAGPIPVGRSKSSLASFVAKRIGEEIRKAERSDCKRLGTEAEIGERLGVSRQVVRQAVRILESQGAVESRRGRTHGVSTTAPEPTVAVEAVVALLSSMRISEGDIRAACAIMGRLTRMLVGAKAKPAHFKEFERLVQRGHTWGGVNMFSQWIRLDWKIIDNPVLCIFAQALTGCRVRLAKDACTVPVNGSPAVQQALAEYVAAAKKRDLAFADQSYDELAMLVRAAFRAA
jgi:DNA-binding transcriptional regulator YhcF (GntR family)